MAVPTVPYCTSAQVALFLHNIAPTGDFGTSTHPTKASVESLITLYSSLVNVRFAANGYVMPWQELTGETWPGHQTVLLQMMTAMGVAGALAGPILKPAPALPGQRGVADNEFTAYFNKAMDQIAIDGHGFRAAYRIGSLAEKFIDIPHGPLTDFLLDIVDASAYQTPGEYTEMIEAVREQYQVQYGPWDQTWLRRQEQLT